MSTSINLQNQLRINTERPGSAITDTSSTSGNYNSDILIEDLSEELNKKFIQQKLKKYFKDLYKDLSTIKSQPTASGAVLIDRNAFVEFINCPGIISERLFNIASKGSKEERIEEKSFVNLMLEIYSSDLDGKLKFVFKVFDFDGDGKITSEDVQMILSYVPR